MLSLKNFFAIFKFSNKMFILYILLFIVSLVILVPLVLIIFVLLVKRDMVMEMAKNIYAKTEESLNFNSKSSDEASFDNNSITKSEALKILGLTKKADNKDISEAYRKLMKHMHPDKGGSDFLAQQINQARKVLLKK